MPIGNSKNGKTISAASQRIEDCAEQIWQDRRSHGAAKWDRASNCAFAELLRRLKPRIRALIRQYGLTDMIEDAEQAGAIGVHRALSSFDPAKARFSTHVTWQIRGELQSLRHRTRLDQRRSARSAGMVTVSLEALGGMEDGTPFEIIDNDAFARTEQGANENMVHTMMDQLLDRLGAPEDERAIMYDTLYDRDPGADANQERSSEQRRQVVRRTWRNCIKVMAA
ncbi:MAG: sigma factor [Erythrobacter sp.]